MENRVEQKLEWNGRSEAREIEWKGKKPQKQKGKWSMGKNRTETQKEEIWDITVSPPSGQTLEASKTKPGRPKDEDKRKWKGQKEWVKRKKINGMDRMEGK